MKKYTYRFDWSAPSAGTINNGTGVSIEALTKRLEDLALEIVRKVNKGEAVQLIVCTAPLQQ